MLLNLNLFVYSAKSLVIFLPTQLKTLLYCFWLFTDMWIGIGVAVSVLVIVIMSSAALIIKKRNTTPPANVQERDEANELGEYAELSTPKAPSRSDHVRPSTTESGEYDAVDSFTGVGSGYETMPAASETAEPEHIYSKVEAN